MMKSTLLPFLLFLAVTTFGQNKISYDLDTDGKVDKLELVNTDDGMKITYALSSQGNKVISTQNITTAGDQRTVSMSKNVVVLAINYMRASYTYKFRYDPKLKQIKVIGYDNEQFGNAVNDGSGMSSYNLLTGAFEANWNHWNDKKKQLIPDPKISKKLPIKTYLLKDFSDSMIEALEKVK
jgi:hypothetical protein